MRAEIDQRMRWTNAHYGCAPYVDDYGLGEPSDRASLFQNYDALVDTQMQFLKSTRVIDKAMAGDAWRSLGSARRSMLTSHCGTKCVARCFSPLANAGWHWPNSDAQDITRLIAPSSSKTLMTILPVQVVNRATTIWRVATRKETNAAQFLAAGAGAQ